MLLEGMVALTHTHTIIWLLQLAMILGLEREVYQIVCKLKTKELQKVALLFKGIYRIGSGSTPKAPNFEAIIVVNSEAFNAKRALVPGSEVQLRA